MKLTGFFLGKIMVESEKSLRCDKKMNLFFSLQNYMYFFLYKGWKNFVDWKTDSGFELKFFLFTF